MKGENENVSFIQNTILMIVLGGGFVEVVMVVVVPLGNPILNHWDMAWILACL